jgi:hypothetical protein
MEGNQINYPRSRPRAMKFPDKKLFPGFDFNPPLSAEAITKFEAESGVRLRQDYAAFLLLSNGGEGSIGNGYANLWRLEEIIEMNRSYQVADFAPGLLLFGSDGGGEAFAFDNRSEQQVIVSAPFIPLDLNEISVLAPNFAEFVEAIANS